MDQLEILKTILSNALKLYLVCPTKVNEERLIGIAESYRDLWVIQTMSSDECEELGALEAGLEMYADELEKIFGDVLGSTP